MFQLLTKKTKREPGEQKRDPLFLFLCQLEWRESHDLNAYQELVAALDDSNEVIRTLAEDMLHRVSPRRRHTPAKNGACDDL